MFILFESDEEKKSYNVDNRPFPVPEFRRQQRPLPVRIGWCGSGRRTTPSSPPSTSTAEACFTGAGIRHSIIRKFHFQGSLIWFHNSDLTRKLDGEHFRGLTSVCQSRSSIGVITLHPIKCFDFHHLRYGRYRRFAYTSQSPSSGVSMTIDRGTDPMLASTSSTTTTTNPTLRPPVASSLGRAGGVNLFGLS